MKTKTHSVRNSIISEVMLFVVIFALIYGLFDACMYLFNACSL